MDIVAFVLMWSGALIILVHLLLSAAEHKNIKARLIIAAENHSKLIVMEAVGLICLFCGIAMIIFQ